MNYTCTKQTDLDELIGSERLEGRGLAFCYGPLVLAMKRGEELVLENSAQMSPFTRAKLPALLVSLTIEETAEVVRPHDGFRLTLR